MVVYHSKSERILKYREWSCLVNGNTWTTRNGKIFWYDIYVYGKIFKDLKPIVKMLQKYGG